MPVISMDNSSTTTMDHTVDCGTGIKTNNLIDIILNYCTKMKSFLAVMYITPKMYENKRAFAVLITITINVKMMMMASTTIQK